MKYIKILLMLPVTLNDRVTNEKNKRLGKINSNILKIYRRTQPGVINPHPEF